VPSPAAADIDLVAELLDARLDVRLEPLGAFVFGDGAQHLAQVLQPLARLARLAVRSLGRLVLGAEIGRHGLVDYKPNIYIIRHRALGRSRGRHAFR